MNPPDSDERRWTTDKLPRLRNTRNEVDWRMTYLYRRVTQTPEEYAR